MVSSWVAHVKALRWCLVGFSKIESLILLTVQASDAG